MRANISITYDMWAPAIADSPLSDHYEAMFNQAAYAEEHGFEAISFNEHHGAETGYNPAPLTATAAVAARTKKIKLRPLLLIPFMDPIRLAEELAVIDHISGGNRLEPIFAAGYRPEEFAMFGASLGDRRKLVDGAIGVMRKAWTGEWFEHDGRRARVMPRPTANHPKILVAGASKAGARAAAELGDGFYPISPAFWPAYRDACLALGKPDPGTVGKRSPMFVHVAENPDAVWPKLAPFILSGVRQYREWTLENMPVPPQFSVSSEAELRASGQYVVLTPDQAIAMFRELGDNCQVIFRPQWGGFHPDLGWESLRLVVEKVLPAIRNL